MIDVWAKISSGNHIRNIVLYLPVIKWVEEAPYVLNMNCKLERADSLPGIFRCHVLTEDLDDSIEYEKVYFQQTVTSEEREGSDDINRAREFTIYRGTRRIYHKTASTILEETTNGTDIAILPSNPRGV